MSVPPKPVFAGGVLPTSTASALADLAAYGVYPPGAVAARQTNQLITSGAATPVSFDAEKFDNTGLMFAPTSTDITIVDTGLYDVKGWTQYDFGTTGIRQLEVAQNGASVWGDARSAQSAASRGISIGATLVCTAGDILQLWIYQSQTSSINVTAARFAVCRISG